MTMRHWITSFRLLNDAQFTGDSADVKARHQTAGFSLFTRLVHRAPEPFQGQQHHRLGRDRPDIDAVLMRNDTRLTA